MSHNSRKFAFTLLSTNYGYWKIMIEPLLITNNLMGYVDGSIPCPSKTLSVTDGATVLKENLSNLGLQRCLQMHGDETPDAYLNRAQEYADALIAINEPVKDKDLVMLAVLGPQAFYGARPSNNNRNNNINNRGNRNNSCGNNNNRGRDTRGKSRVTLDLEAMDNSESYYYDDALHVGNGKGLPILYIGSSKV
nr:hypothetical protein [Tanacetum cinerariifolium]